MAESTPTTIAVAQSKDTIYSVVMKIVALIFLLGNAYVLAANADEQDERYVLRFANVTHMALEDLESGQDFLILMPGGSYSAICEVEITAQIADHFFNNITYVSNISTFRQDPVLYQIVDENNDALLTVNDYNEAMRGNGTQGSIDRLKSTYLYGYVFGLVSMSSCWSKNQSVNQLNYDLLDPK